MASLAFALPLAMLAFTGLETVANLAAETREPGKTLPRSLFLGLGAGGAESRSSSAPSRSRPTRRTRTRRAERSLHGARHCVAEGPLMGLVAALEGHIPGGLVDMLRIVTGASGVIVLAAAITTSMSGAGRVAYSLGQHAMLPHSFGVLNRRTLLPPVAIISAASISSGLLLLSWGSGRRCSSSRASTASAC